MHLFRSYDLLYEWLFEIRGKFFLSEYCIVWATFLAIQVVGMDAGIVIGVLVAIVGHVIHSAKTTGVYRLNKKSRAVWTPEQYRLLQDHGYNLQAPKIVTLGTFRSLYFPIFITESYKFMLHRNCWEYIFWLISSVIATNCR
jgi:MFS superfamily sulfate permease-like transporter